MNLFGYAGIDPIYGGTGSGSGDTSANIDPVTGLKEAGLEVNPELVDFYKRSGVSRAAQSGYTGSDFTPAEVPASAYTEAVLSQARDYADVAVVMISRVGGEGGDLPMDMYAAGYSKTDDDRHYLELTQDEEDLLALVKSQNYDKVVVLANSSNAMELGFLREEGIDAALWIGSPGAVGFRAVGEVLTGKVTPSGRLTDTYAYDLTTAPAYWNAGSFTYGNAKRSYVEYAEGIYVGYRFNETRWIDNATGVCDEEAYRMGYMDTITTLQHAVQWKNKTHISVFLLSGISYAPASFRGSYCFSLQSVNGFNYSLPGLRSIFFTTQNLTHISFCIATLLSKTFLRDSDNSKV